MFKSVHLLVCGWPPHGLSLQGSCRTTGREDSIREDDLVCGLGTVGLSLAGCIFQLWRCGHTMFGSLSGMDGIRKDNQQV